MTATATQVPTRQCVSEKEWVKLFPKQVTDTYTSSVTFIKQLTVVTLSTITYFKNALPENSYTTEILSGLYFKVLKDKCEDDLAQFLSSSLKNAFEAFEKKYVEHLVLCFYNGNCVPENLIEYYTIEYTYHSEGVSLNINSKNRNSDKSLRCSMESVQDKVMMLMRVLTVIANQSYEQPPLPLNLDMSLRLYYNNDAPEDYQAPGFEACTGPDPVAKGLRSGTRLGCVATPYHKFVAKHTWDIPGLMADDQTSRTTEQLDVDVEDGSMNCEVDSESLEPLLRCPCGKQDVTEQLLITCQYCHTQQHATCFGLMAPVTKHCCEECAAKDPSRRATCPLFSELHGRKLESVCIIRRTLVYCLHQSSITGEELMAKFDLTATSTARIIQALIQKSILLNNDPSGTDLTIVRSINPIRLKAACKQFFQMERDRIVERVIAETEASNSLSVEEALSPIEKITLMETNIGTVIDKPKTMNMTPPLKDFSEIELPTQDILCEELPLSGSHNPVNVPGTKKRLKRKKEIDDDWMPKLPKLRSGAAKNKRL